MMRGMREDIEQTALSLFPYPEHSAGRLHIALVQPVNANIQGDWPFDRFDHVAKRNGLGGTRKLIATARSAPRLHQASAHQIADNLLQVIFGDALLARRSRCLSRPLG